MALNFLKHVPQINFVRYRFIAYIVSLAFIILSFVAIFMNNGLKYGVDFAGGVMVQIKFNQAIPDEVVKNALNPLNIPGLTIQQFGDGESEYLIRFNSTESTDVREIILQALNQSLPNSNPTIERVEMVGPKVGEDLKNSALEAMFYAVLLITVYISGRFEQKWFIAGGIALALAGLVYLTSFFDIGRALQIALAMVVTLTLCYFLKLNFAFGAIVSLLHDVAITFGILTLLGKEIDLNIIAALLTLIGYSLNDTIIIYDRIRENLKTEPENSNRPFKEIINVSINQTLSRTILTGGTTLLAVLSLFILGGGVIHDFAFTMLIGIVIGTFSSIFVASPILLALGNTELYLTHRKKTDINYEKPGEHGIV